MPQRPPRVKKWHSKTSTGCLTCKIRRIKCDEGKPVCYRCQKAQVKCRGYAPPPKPWLFDPAGQSNQFTPAPSLSTCPTLTGYHEEQRMFQFFRERTVPTLSNHSALTYRFFNEVVPQLARSEPLIMHIVVALAARHEINTCQSGSLDSSLEICTKNHSIALKMLTDPQSQPALDMIVMACSLLISYENFTEPGDQSTRSLLHLTSGMRILREEQARRKGVKSGNEIIDGILEPIFAQLDLVLAVFRLPFPGEIICPEAIPRPEIPVAFLTHHSAQRSFFQIHQWWFYTVASSQELTKLAQGILEMRLLLQEWYQALLAYQKLMIAEQDATGLFMATAFSTRYRFVLIAFQAAGRKDIARLGDALPISIDLSHPGKLVTTYSTRMPAAWDESKLDQMSSKTTEMLDSTMPTVEVIGMDKGRIIVQIVMSE